MSKPINLNPLVRLFFTAAPAVNTALQDGNITVSEAIDIAAATAKAAAHEAGIADKVIATTNADG